MKINCSNIENPYQTKTVQQRFNPNLTPLKQDTVSFGALKKSQFEGLDFAAVEKFKAPIEQFKTNDDLQNWCKSKIKTNILNKDFGGRQEETKIQRKAMLKEWTDYVLKENEGYNSATSLIILSAVTKGLNPDNDKLPPVLNKGVLADCISEIETNLKKDKKYSFDFNKMYQNKLQALYLEDYETGEKGTKWIIIPSKKNDSQNFAQNVDKLKILSHCNWCTKSYNAEPYLSKGDFHVYLENGKPKVGIRFVDNKIQEIQGELNNSIIPFDYFNMVQDYINDKNLKLSSNAKNEIKETEKIIQKAEKIKTDLKEAIENNNAVKIYEYLGFKLKTDKDGFITLDKYFQPDIPFKMLGIDEQKLFDKVKRIEGDANFTQSNLNTLSNLEYIGGYLFSKKGLNLGKLKVIGDRIFNDDNIDIFKTNIESINGVKIKEIIKESETNTYNPEKIFQLCGIKTQKDENGFLTISHYDSCIAHFLFEDLGIDENKLLEKVKRIEGNATFISSYLTSLGSIEYIGGDMYLSTPNVTSLGNLKTVGGNFSLYNETNLKSLENLEYIGGNLNFNDSKLTSLGALKKVGGSINFENTKVTSLGNLEYIGKDVNFDNSQITDLGKLKRVDGIVYRKHSKLKYSDIKDLERGHNKLYYLWDKLWYCYPD